MPQVFISYSRKDLEFIERLVADLQAAGLTVWYDLSGLEAGKRWGSEIQIAIRNSQFFLVVLSPNSLASKWVEREFLYAETHHIKVIPLQYMPCEQPMWLLDLQLIDMQVGSYERNFERLLKGLGVQPRVAERQARQEAETKARLEAEAIEMKARQEEQTRLAEEERLRKKAEQEKIDAGIKAKKEAEAREQQDHQEQMRKAKAGENLRKQAARDQARAAGKVRRAETWNKWKPRLPRLAGLTGLGVLLILGGYFLLPLITSSLGGQPLRVETQVTQTSATLQTQLPAFTRTPFPTARPTITITSTLTPSPTSALSATPFTIQTRVRGADQGVMVFVPAGPFIMGSNDFDPDSAPEQTVTLEAYWIDRTEVTNEMYKSCVYFGACPPITDLGSTYILYYFDHPEYAHNPVTSVDWETASTYCQFAGARLPSEAEWEKAARGVNGREFPWGNSLPDETRANFNVPIPDGSIPGTFNHVTKPVGSYPAGASFYGALDMAGNLEEWTNDWYQAYPGGDLRASDKYGISYKVTRGGSWSVNLVGLRTTLRIPRQPSDIGNKDIGFRCVKDDTTWGN